MPSSPTSQSDWNDSKVIGAEDLAKATRVAQRLRAEMRALYELVPTQARTGTGFARLLGVDRGTATRFVNVCRKSIDDVRILHEVPGIKGLHQVIQAMSNHGYDPSALDLCRVAIDQFERLIHEFGGSQTKLQRRLLDATRDGQHDQGDSASELAHQRRAKLFESAAEAVGQRMELRTATQVFRPTPGVPGKMDQAMLRGTFGYRCRSEAPPYTLRSYGRNDLKDTQFDGEPGDRAYGSLEGIPALGVASGIVLEDYSSDPVPLVTMRGSGKEALIVVDPERGAMDEGVDITIANLLEANWGLPINDDPPTHEISTFVKSPAARMIFDVFLHSSMAGQCLPSMKVYLTSPGIFHNRAEYWTDELPFPPKLELLGLGGGKNLGSHLFLRHEDMTRYFFNKLGWDIEEYVGYRCEVEYPLWCGFYCMIFDYSVAAGNRE